MEHRDVQIVTWNSKSSVVGGGKTAVRGHGGSESVRAGNRSNNGVQVRREGGIVGARKRRNCGSVNGIG